MSITRVMGWLLACVIGTTMSACGGGGGSSGPAGVTFTVDTVDHTTGQIYESQSFPGLFIHARAGGDLTSLNGQTLYFVLDVSDPRVFTTTPVVSLDSDFLGGTLSVGGQRAPDGPATYSGTLTVHVCLDAACSRPLTVNNPTIHYSYDVKRGLTASAYTVQLSHPFGDPLASTSVALSLPDGVTDYTLETWTSDTGFIRATAQPSPSPAILFEQVQDFTPGFVYGTYLGQPDQFIVRATTTDGQPLSIILTATGTVTDSGRQAAFQLPALSDGTTAGTSVAFELSDKALFVNPDGNLWQLVDSQYTVIPDAAVGLPQAQQWASVVSVFDASYPFQESLTATALSCVGTTCLPPGHYEVRFHFQYTPVGQPVEDLYLPVSMDLAP